VVGVDMSQAMGVQMRSHLVWGTFANYLRGTCAGLVVGTLAAAACAKAPWGGPVSLRHVDTGPGSLTEARRYLEGRWTLMSFVIFPTGKPALESRGAGTLFYDAFGNMDIEVRVDEGTARVLEQEGIPSSNGVISIVGRTVVDLDSRTLTFVLDHQALMMPVGGPLSLRRPRHWAVSGNVLTLTTRGADGEALSETRWEKGP
jgi:hypothetical protein